MDGIVGDLRFFHFGVLFWKIGAVVRCVYRSKCVYRQYRLVFGFRFSLAIFLGCLDWGDPSIDIENSRFSHCSSQNKLCNIVFFLRSPLSLSVAHIWFGSIFWFSHLIVYGMHEITVWLWGNDAEMSRTKSPIIHDFVHIYTSKAPQSINILCRTTAGITKRLQHRKMKQVKTFFTHRKHSSQPNIQHILFFSLNFFSVFFFSFFTVCSYVDRKFDSTNFSSLLSPSHTHAHTIKATFFHPLI